MRAMNRITLLGTRARFVSVPTFRVDSNFTQTSPYVRACEQPCSPTISINQLHQKRMEQPVDHPLDIMQGDLQLVPPLAELWGPNDDWTGITDYRERKKRQNRLNQRIYREFLPKSVVICLDRRVRLTYLYLPGVRLETWIQAWAWL